MITRKELAEARAWCLATEELYANLSRLYSEPDRYTSESRYADKYRGQLLARERRLAGIESGFWWKRWFWTETRLGRGLGLTYWG